MIGRGYGFKIYRATLDTLAHEVTINFNVFSAFVEDIIVSNVDHTFVIVLERRGVLEVDAHIEAKLTQM